MHGAEVRERIDQRARVLAVLLFRHRYHSLGERQRVGVTPGVEGFPELLVGFGTFGIGNGRRRARGPGGEAACHTGCHR